MATTQAYRITELSKVYSQNLLPAFLTFNKNIPFTGWNTVSGSGIASNDDAVFYKGDRGLYLFSTDDGTAFEANSGGTQTRFTANVTGRYIFQFWVNNPILGVNSGDIVVIKIAKDGAGAWKELSVSASQVANSDTWTGFFYDFQLTAGDYLDFSFVLPANSSYPVGGSHACYIDGLKIEVSNVDGLGFPSAYSEPFIPVPDTPTTDGFYLTRYDLGFPSLYRCLEGSATLDFGSIANGASAELTVTIAGAMEKGKVFVAPPYESIISGCIIDGRVTADNTVTVVYHNSSGGSINPASGTYSIFIIPFVP